MIFVYDYIVTTYPGGPGGFDHGSWSGHGSKKDAIACAKVVEGYCWKVKRKGDTYKIKPVKVDR